MGWDAQGDAIVPQSNLASPHLVFQHGLLHPFCAWTKQALHLAKPMWSHHPDHVHCAAATAFLLENCKAE